MMAELTAHLSSGDAPRRGPRTELREDLDRPRYGLHLWGHDLPGDRPVEPDDPAARRPRDQIPGGRRGPDGAQPGARRMAAAAAARVDGRGRRGRAVAVRRQ